MNAAMAPMVIGTQSKQTIFPFHIGQEGVIVCEM